GSLTAAGLEGPLGNRGDPPVLQNLGLGRCHCRTIQAQENWVWCVVEAFHAVLGVRREVPGMTWRAAQRQAAQHAEQYVLTGLEQDGPLLDAA
ncbi:hypothetical protein, partial [Deinococcus indicus]|uniref:hypothetical protein n=1 Tax=Deinococcus indicus TaxID=223556 RepID=UPI001E36BE35